jgi:hypothetical protein
MKRCWRTLMLALCTAAATTGCQKPRHMDPSAMQPPPRAAELDRLEQWVGTWQTTGEMKGCDGKIMHMTGMSTVAWECDRTVLVDRMETVCEEMKDMGKMTMLSVYRWDATEKEYEMNWFDSFGTASDGDMTYNEATKTWHITGDGYNPMYRQNTHFAGSVRMPDSSTMEWIWTVWDAWKMTKLEEGKGTSKRG